MKLQSLLLVDNLAIKWLILSCKSTKEFVDFKFTQKFELKIINSFCGQILFISEVSSFYCTFCQCLRCQIWFWIPGSCFLVLPPDNPTTFSLRSKIKLTNIHSRNFFHHHHPAAAVKSTTFLFHFNNIFLIFFLF